MKKLKEKLKKSDNKFIDFLKTVYHLQKKILAGIKNYIYILTYYFCRIFPVNEKKIVASTFNGKKYGDNCQYIVEELMKLDSTLDIVWMKDDNFDYKVPDGVRTLSMWKHNFKKIYEYSTAKVWIDTHRIDAQKRKRKNQLFIETWHGGLGIKKLDGDVPKFSQDKVIMAEVNNMSKLADIFISNSDHLSRIYKSAFHYDGVIWKSGYPKNDIIFKTDFDYQNKIKQKYNITDSNAKIIVYAPTFRDDYYGKGLNLEVYNIDYLRLYKNLKEKTSCEWIIMVKYHPILINESSLYNNKYDFVINVSDYPDMQEIILAADAFISDYSSCIFDAALRKIPCFTFATDFEDYKGDRGVYYEMEELPFPYARNNDELVTNILDFDYDKYKNDLAKFEEKTGLHETGHAAEDIAYVINEFIKGNRKPLEEIKSE